MVARRAHNPEVAGSSPVSATNKSHADAWLFPFACFVADPSPRGIAAGIFLFRRQEIARQKNTHFFMAGERGKKSTKTGHTKTNDTMMIIMHSISSSLVFCTLGRNGALVFFAAFRRRLFHLYLFFHSNASPGFFIFPCFFAGICGGPKRRLNPLAGVPFMGISPPASGPRTPPKTSGKMTG